MLIKIETLVKSQKHLVLATCAQGLPHASLMAYCVAEATPRAGGEFWLATLRGTRKFAALCENPRASLLIDDRSGEGAGDGRQGRTGAGAAGGPTLALTVEAECQPFDSTVMEGAARAALAARHPGLEGFLALPEVAMLRFVPLRYQLLSGLTETFLWSPAESA